MNTYISIFIIAFFSLFANLKGQNNYATYVNPFIGTGGHGHTFPGAVLPFGMVQLSPDTRADGSWDGCSGYHYSDSIIFGFSHTHLSGTGCSDWGDILVMPTVGKTMYNQKDYASKFSHKNENASAGFYEVVLNKGNIKAELTVTPRVGIHRYTFPKTPDANIIIDLLHRDKTLSCDARIKDSVTIVGFRLSKAWAKEQYVFFEMKFSKPFIKSDFYSVDAEITGKNDGSVLNRKAAIPDRDVSDAAGKTARLTAALKFNMTDGLPLLVKVAISSVSNSGAAKNLITEAPHWDFEKYKADAEKIWNTQLQKISIEENNPDKLSTFYTSLYHCFIHPSLNMDVDSMYRGRNNLVQKAENFTNYTVFSLWDTYRALHPLFSIIERKRSLDFINSFYNQYKQAGRLPVWELSSNETDCMIGFHSVSVITDALVKGISGFDTTAMYGAMVAASNYTRFGIQDFNKNSYLQIDEEAESVSKSLEYAYDNWCIAQVAKLLNKKADERIYLKRSQAYKQLFDASTGNMRPRKNGGWLNPFFPNEVNNHFTEGNSWQYSFYVPHDMDGLIKLHGGNSGFEKKLDELFTTNQKTIGREQSDLTGLIGQYAHGNEPSHHIAYLYNYIGRPQKTIQRVQQICNDFYKNSPDGLIGNEDCGQMSAWYIFSSLGFYPVCPGSPNYVLSEPLFKKVQINLENGKQFTIESNTDIKGSLKLVMLNNIKQSKSYINHDAILSGSSLKFIKDANEKDNVYGVQKMDTPPSFVGFDEFIPSPIINSPKQVFKDKQQITIDMINIQPLIVVYTLDGSEPNSFSTVYRGPITIDSTCTIKAKIFANHGTSNVSVAKFYKLNNDYDIVIKSKANTQYQEQGAQTLMDGIKGDIFWKKGGWLGYQYQDFECVVDMKATKDISYLSLECLQDTRSWIIFPTEVSYFGSNDGKTYAPIATIKSTFNEKDYNVRTEEFSKQLKQKVKYRYIKVKAKNFGKLPSWHEGVGDSAFIFVDELEIR